MNTTQLLKGLFIAVPMLTLAACATGPDADGTAEQQRTQDQAQQQQQQDSGVEMGAAERPQTPQEIREAKFAELRQQNIIYFTFDESRVLPEFAEQLEAHADFLVKNPGTNVTIEGHADERGTPEYNIALGERRAKAVAQYLQNLGVSESQINTVSYGEEKPMVNESTPAAYAKNRRAVLVY